MLPERRDRYLGLLSTRRGRDKFRKSLVDFRAWDDRFVRNLAPHLHRPADIEGALRKLGAPDQCYVFAESDALDGRELRLGDALSAIIGRDYGAVVSCLPGTLAFYEGEDCRFVLHRP